MDANTSTALPATLDPTLPTSDGLVDRVFRTRRIRLEDTLMYAGLRTGQWMRNNSGQVSPGAIGVLMDIALGGAAMQYRPASTWAVTTNLSVHFVKPLPADGSEILATGRYLVADASGCMAEGEAVDSEGQVVAKGSTWLQYVASEPDIERYADSVNHDASLPASITEALDLEAGDEQGEYTFTVGQNQLNVNSSLHGGVSLALAEAAGTTYVNDSAFMLATMNLTYLRPGHGQMTLRVHPVHRGRSLQILDVSLIDAHGKTCVVANLHYRRAS